MDLHIIAKLSSCQNLGISYRKQTAFRFDIVAKRLSYLEAPEAARFAEFPVDSGVFPQQGGCLGGKVHTPLRMHFLSWMMFDALGHSAPASFFAASHCLIDGEQGRISCTMLDN